MLKDAYIFDTDSIPPSAEVVRWAQEHQAPAKAPRMDAPALDWPLWVRLCIGLGGVLLLLSGLWILGVGLAMEVGLL